MIDDFVDVGGDVLQPETDANGKQAENHREAAQIDAMS